MQFIFSKCYHATPEPYEADKERLREWITCMLKRASELPSEEYYLHYHPDTHQTTIGRGVNILRDEGHSVTVLPEPQPQCLPGTPMHDWLRLPESLRTTETPARVEGDGEAGTPRIGPPGPSQGLGGPG